MIRVRCPDCDARLEVDDADRGQEVRCPSCRAVFVARDEGEPLPPPVEELPSRRRRERLDTDEDFDRPRRRRRRPLYDDDPEDIIEDTRQAVRLPALLSIIACLLTILFHTADTIFILTNPQALKNNPLNFGGANPPPLEVIIGAKGFILIYELVVLIGSVAMMRLKSHKFALAAMVMQIIPCAGVCCILGLGIGIWGLVTLNRSDVKEGFVLVEEEARRGERQRVRGEDDEDDERDDR